MGLFAQVGGLADDVVFAVVNLGYPTLLVHFHPIANHDWIGAADILQPHIAFDVGGNDLGEGDGEVDGRINAENTIPARARIIIAYKRNDER